MKSIREREFYTRGTKILLRQIAEILQTSSGAKSTFVTDFMGKARTLTLWRDPRLMSASPAV